MIWSSLALASTFEPVVTDLGAGARVDWTALRIEVTASRSRAGSEGTRAVEELARRDVDDGMQPAARKLPIAPGRVLADLEDSPELWGSVSVRMGRWLEAENRYHASGRVSVVGALPLVDLMKPVVMATARAKRGIDASHTGAIVDARGTEAVPCYRPEITDAKGTVLYGGDLWLEAAAVSAPVTWVSDAAHPAVDRAGEQPLLAAAASAQGCRIALGDATGFAELAETTRLGEGTLVIVVDR